MTGEAYRAAEAYDDLRAKFSGYAWEMFSAAFHAGYGKGVENGVKAERERAALADHEAEVAEVADLLRACQRTARESADDCGCGDCFWCAAADVWDALAKRVAVRAALSGGTPQEEAT